MIHIVIGQSGMYSGAAIWKVRAFTEQADAEALCDKLNAWCVAHGYNNDANNPWVTSESGSGTPAEDPHFCYMWGCIRYTVEAVPVGDESDTRPKELP